VQPPYHGDGAVADVLVGEQKIGPARYVQLVNTRTGEPSPNFSSKLQRGTQRANNEKGCGIPQDNKHGKVDQDDDLGPRHATQRLVPLSHFVQVDGCK